MDRQRSLTWAQRLKRVFAIDIETCRRCGGKLRVIASIEDAPARRASLFRLYQADTGPPRRRSRAGRSGNSEPGAAPFAGVLGSIGRHRPGFNRSQRLRRWHNGPL